jgi:hypothetical protein
MAKYILRKNICWLFILLVIAFYNAGVRAQSTADINPIEQSQKLDFDKKKYNELVENILRTAPPSALSAAITKIIKESVYLSISCLAGGLSGVMPDQVPSALCNFATAYVLLKVFLDPILASKDQTLENLKKFQEYAYQTFLFSDDLNGKSSELLLKFFEKDYDLIFNKIDRDGGPGTFRKIISFLFQESIFLLVSGAMGTSFGFIGHDSGVRSFVIGAGVGVFYFALLTLSFSILLADKDQHLLKIETLRAIDQFLEEIKNKLAAQHEAVASNETVAAN